MNFSTTNRPVRRQLGTSLREHGVLQIPRLLPGFRGARPAVQLLEALRLGLLHGHSGGAVRLAGGASGEHTEGQEHHPVMTDVELLVIPEKVARHVYISPRVRQEILGSGYEVVASELTFLVWDSE